MRKFCSLASGFKNEISRLANRPEAPEVSRLAPQQRTVHVECCSVYVPEQLVTQLMRTSQGRPVAAPLGVTDGSSHCRCSPGHAERGIPDCFLFPFFKNHTTRFLRSDLTYPAVRRNKPKSPSDQERSPTWLTVAPSRNQGPVTSPC